MEQRTQSTKVQRQRKLLLVLPLLVMPFMTMMFWSLGGGEAGNADTKPLLDKGFNTKLPDAYLKSDGPLDKMGYYDKAASDSAKLQELIKNDPNYRIPSTRNSSGHETKADAVSIPRNDAERGTLLASPYHSGIDTNEERVLRKLAELDQAMNQHAPAIEPTENIRFNRSENMPVNTNDIDRLEQMMQSMDQSQDEDPELKQINGMLEKILDIQHPDRVQEKIRQTSEARRGQVFAVSAASNETPVSLLGHLPEGINSSLLNQPGRNGFYSLDESVLNEQEQSAVQAVVHETQTLVAGSTIKLRLADDIYINGILIPKDNFIFGEAMLNGERLSIKITNIRYQNSLLPVGLSVYDMDGMEGIYVPGAITRDVAKQSAGRAVQDFGLTTFDPSLGAQAASAGIGAARDLIRKKAKLVKVTVKAGYQVLLKDEMRSN
jgi:conjugative transposon TraM protein